MTEIGESVAVAVPESESEDSHDELELELTDIVDAEGTSLMGSANDYDVRQNAVVGDTRTTIRFETRHQETFVFLAIQPAQGSTVARSYYRGDEVAFFMDWLEPGQHSFEWDGCARGAQRLLVEGDYEVVIDAFCPECETHIEHRTTIHVRKPWAHCYGGVYGGAGALVGSTLQGNYTTRANDASTALASLADGSGFESQTHSASAGSAALVQLHEEAAVWYWGGHGGPGIISLPTPGGMTAIVSESAVASGYSGIVTAANCASVAGLPDDALEDVFMVVLCGCQTSATPGNGASLPSALIAKGVDVVIGFDLSIYTLSANKWTRDFFRYLKRGMGVEDAIRRANRRAANAQYRQRLNSYRLFTGSGASRNITLSPARYGRR